MFAGPEFVAESGRCSYLFNWYTNIVCQSQTILDNCATTDDQGQTYDLSVLRNHGGNYRIAMNDGSFIEFNICRTLFDVTKSFSELSLSNEKEVKNMLSMGAVMVHEKDGINTLMNLGKPSEPQYVKHNVA